MREKKSFFLNKKPVKTSKLFQDLSYSIVYGTYTYHMLNIEAALLLKVALSCVYLLNNLEELWQIQMCFVFIYLSWKYCIKVDSHNRAAPLEFVKFTYCGHALYDKFNALSGAAR